MDRNVQRALLLSDMPDLGTQAFSPLGKSMRLYKGGGGGGGTYYEGQERLLQSQADQADLLAGVARDTVIPNYNNLVAEASASGNIAQQNTAAQFGREEAQLGISQNREATMRNLASMGIDPSDPRYVRMLTMNDPANAAVAAGAANSERNRVRDQGFARRQDAVSLGLGLPSQASASYGSAAGGYQNIINSQVQQQQAQQSAIGNAVGGAIGAYGMYKSFADGGYVSRSSKDGAPKFAGGGFTGGGFMKPVSSGPVVGGGGAPKPSGGERALMGISAGAQGMAMGKAGASMVGDAAAGIGNLTGNVGMSSFGAGAANPAAATAAADAYAAAAVESAAAAELGAGAAGAAELSAASSGLGAGATFATAMPWVAGGLLASEALGITDFFADGGRVDGQQGGEVDGPGGPTDDVIPAWLSDGEFVLNADAVRHFGLDRLEKMNQVGLDLRNGKRGISRKSGDSK